MTQHQIWFTGSDNYKLYGVLTLPETTTPPPLVIMCHGFGSPASQSPSYLPLINPLLNHNIACFYYDRMGLGKSQGDFAHTTPTHDLLDLKLAVEAVTRQNNFPQIALFAKSYGGFLALIHAAANQNINNLCLVAPVVNVKTWIRQSFLKVPRKELVKNYNHRARKYDYLYSSFVVDALKYNPLVQAPKLTQPLLIIHGDQDATIPLSTSQQLLKRSSSLDKSLAVIHGANHWFEGHVEEQNQAIINWLIQKLT